MGIKTQVKARGFHWYTINRNKDSQDRIAGSMRWAGSFYLHPPSRKRTFELHWYLLHQATSSLAVEYRRGNWTGGRKWHVAIPRLFSLFFIIKFPISKPERSLDVRVFKGCVWWTLWDDPNEWHRGSRQYTWHVRDWILGKDKYSERDLETGEVEIPLPEAAYKAQYTEQEATWTRPRGRTKRVRRYTFEFSGDGLPVPGKGENSWDMDDDAIQGITVNARSLHEAVGKVVSSALRSRYAYGGRNWRPVASAE